MEVIAERIGLPIAEWPRFRRWSDAIPKISYPRSGGEEAAQAASEFHAVTVEMDAYLTEMIGQRRAA